MTPATPSQDMMHQCVTKIATDWRKVILPRTAHQIMDCSSAASGNTCGGALLSSTSDQQRILVLLASQFFHQKPTVKVVIFKQLELHIRVA